MLSRSGFLSILYSIGTKPLQIWDKQVRARSPWRTRGKVEMRVSGGRGEDATRPRASLRTQVKNGHIKRITDQDIQSSVLEVCGDNVANVYITGARRAASVSASITQRSRPGTECEGRAQAQAPALPGVGCLARRAQRRRTPPRRWASSSRSSS